MSERFIHESLDEKYKQQCRVENARKQKKRQGQEEGDENLAALAPLNLEEVNKNKDLMIYDLPGSIEDEENPKLSPTSGNAVINDSTVANKAASQPLELKDESTQDSKRCSRCEKLHLNLELKEALEKSNQFTIADNISSDRSSSPNFSCVNSINKPQSHEDTTYRIPKGKHDLLIAAMQNSREFCSVVFDKNRILVHAGPDILREMTND